MKSSIFKICSMGCFYRQEMMQESLSLNILVSFCLLSSLKMKAIMVLQLCNGSSSTNNTMMHSTKKTQFDSLCFKWIKTVIISALKTLILLIQLDYVIPKITPQLATSHSSHLTVSRTTFCVIFSREKSTHVKQWIKNSHTLGISPLT